MTEQGITSCRIGRRHRERDRVGVWGFGNVSTDVVQSLVAQGIGKEIVFYSRPKDDYPNRAGAWVKDLKANALRRPEITGTNCLEDMAGLDVIFIGVGVPRRGGQTRRDLLAINVEVIARTAIDIRSLYEGCRPDDLPVLVFMGNPVTTMTWVGYKVTGFKKNLVMGQAGNLDSRRICYALSEVIGLSGNDMQGIVFGDHGDSMVASPRYFTVGGVPLDVFAAAQGIAPEKIVEIIETAKKGGTHFVNETGKSASAGPARAACDMLRCIIQGQPEVQPVVSIIEKEYGLILPGDGIESIGFGVPARIGRSGVEQVYELPVEDFHNELLASAAIIKEDVRQAASILKDKFAIT